MTVFLVLKKVIPEELVEASLDRIKRSKQAMCNMWDEWEGMQEVVKEERGKVN